MKKNKIKNVFLEQLRKIPIVTVACEKVGLSRNSVYRWRNEDAEFLKEMDIALSEGEALVNDMSESQLLSLIQEKNWSAISFWLRHRNPKFKERIEVNANINQINEKLTLEQESIVREALNLAALSDSGVSSQNKNEDDSTGSESDPTNS
jgi:hypothetical protein